MGQASEKEEKKAELSKEQRAKNEAAVKGRLDQATKDVLACGISIPICISSLPSDLIGAEHGKERSTMVAAFNAFCADAYRNGGENGPQGALIGIGGKAMPLEDFRKIEELIDSKRNALMEEAAAKGLSKGDAVKEVDTQLDAWFLAELAANQHPAFQFLNANLGGSSGVRKFLVSYGQNSYSTYFPFFFDYVGGTAGRATSDDVTVNFDSTLAGVPHGVSIAKNLSVKELGEGGADKEAFAPGTMLCIQQRFIGLREGKAGAAPAGDFRVSASTNSPDLAKRMFQKFCDGKLKKLEAKYPALKALRARKEQKPKPTSYFTRESEKEKIAQRQAEEQEARELAQVDPEDRFLWDSLYSVMHNMPKSQHFHALLKQMGDKVPPVADTDALYTPATAYLVWCEAQREAGKCVKICDGTMKQVANEEGASQKRKDIRKAADEFSTMQMPDFTKMSPEQIKEQISQWRMASEKFVKDGQAVKDSFHVPSLWFGH